MRAGYRASVLGLIPTAFLAVFLSVQTVQAEELDFPQDPDAAYSVTDRNQYACLRNGMIRAIYVEYTLAAGEPPCDVVYEKSPPEQSLREIPWSAQSARGYCEGHARNLVEKLRDWGWKCGLFRDVLGIND